MNCEGWVWRFRFFEFRGFELIIGFGDLVGLGFGLIGFGDLVGLGFGLIGFGDLIDFVGSGCMIYFFIFYY